MLPALGARVKKVKGLADELALALGSETCRVSRRGPVFSVEIPRLDPQPVHLLSLQKQLSDAPEHRRQMALVSVGYFPSVDAFKGKRLKKRLAKKVLQHPDRYN